MSESTHDVSQAPRPEKRDLGSHGVVWSRIRAPHGFQGGAGRFRLSRTSKCHTRTRRDEVKSVE
jgi:hypothetical protein